MIDVSLRDAALRCEKIPIAKRAMWPYRLGVKLDQPAEDLRQIAAARWPRVEVGGRCNARAA